MRLLLVILLLSIVNIPPAAAEESPTPRTIVLVPSVRHGHSTMWKTGAIITCTSVGVALAGAALAISGLDNRWENGMGGSPMFWTGIAMSIAGDGGLLIGGPATWIAGTHHDAEDPR
jgi:hypothetical protein